MTIASTTSRISYTGNGVTVAFAVPFYFQLNADLVVVLTDTLGVQATQALGTNYTLTGATLSAGGTCTFSIAPTTGYLITIYRDPALTQTTSYNNNDPFPAKSHEQALDKLTTLEQRTRDLITRAIHISDAEDAATVTSLGTVASRKNKLLGFDTNGALTYVVGPTFVGNTSTGVAVVESKATAQITTFAVSVNIVRTQGNATPGDGGGLAYKRGTVASPTPWQDAGGNYWTPATVEPLATNVVTTTSIAADAVTYAKIQNVTAARLLGNPTAGSTDPSEISLGANLAFAGTTLTSTFDPASLFPGYLSGLELSAAGSTATFGIAAGAANDVALGGIMVLTAAKTKTTSAWAVGSGNGALDTGAIAINTWYHAFLIKRVDTSVVDVLFSLSPTSPTMPTNYTLKRRIGSMKTDGSSQWLQFTQVGDDFIPFNAVSDVSNLATTTSRVSKVLSVPTGVVVKAMFRGSIVVTTALYTIFTSLLENNPPAGGGSNVADLSNANSTTASGYFERWTDTSAQIGVKSSGTGATYSISTIGWRDLRGK